ncbi:MAG: N-acetyltransferase [Phycisphaerales bacterium]|nr:MAG: N-acetyltransferase [Phycisphaerales bacterium]
MTRAKPRIRVRHTEERDFGAIAELSRLVYPNDQPWLPEQLASHRRMFPEGQFVAEDLATGEVVGMAASLIVLWDDYEATDSYLDFTGNHMFTNHDPEGRTLYAAEVMVDPRRRRQGIGRKIYAARRKLVRDLGLLRIRAGARLRGYSAYAHQLSAEDYVIRVIRGDIVDPTLSFQISNGFRVIGVVENYLNRDPDSMGWAAVIEWLNHQVASKADYAHRDPRFRKPRKKAASTSSGHSSDAGKRR